MTDLQLEHVTRLFVIIGYAVALAVGANALRRSSMWSRRISSAAIVLIAAVWFGFYLWLFIRRPHPIATTPVLVSRAAHYVTASSLVVMASLISRSERYGMRIMANGDDDA